MNKDILNNMNMNSLSKNFSNNHNCSDAEK